MGGAWVVESSRVVECAWTCVVVSAPGRVMARGGKGCGRMNVGDDVLCREGEGWRGCLCARGGKGAVRESEALSARVLHVALHN